MHKYCKAYRLQDLRQFAGWTEAQHGQEKPRSNDTICYLWDDFTVVRSPVQEQGVVFDAVTSQWKEFCTTTLHFKIPEDVRYAYEQPQEGQNVSS